MEGSSIQLYTEDHRHPAVISGNMTLRGKKYVPLVLPCIPTHPSVRISIFKWKAEVPSELTFCPFSGYHLAEPEFALHNGTYLCVFKDVSDSKVKKLVIDLVISKHQHLDNRLPGIYIDKIVKSSQKRNNFMINQMKLIFISSVLSNMLTNQD